MPVNTGGGADWQLLIARPPAGEGVYVCVCDARGLRESRLNDVGTRRDDADCDGLSWPQQHGTAGGFVARVTSDLRPARERKERECGALFFDASPGPGEEVYVHVRHAQGGALG